MELNTRVFLKKKFKEYYWKNVVKAPRDISSREFGIGTLEEKIKFRHKSFKTEKELNNYLQREAPFYISYSTAYYEFPENQPMPEKNWGGSDLVFDLDASMPYMNRGVMDSVKEEVLNLVEFLISDFGFSKNHIETNFSGNKGYHVHVFNDEVIKLNGEERREIVDYVTGSGLNINYFMREEQSTEGIVYERGVPKRYSSSYVGPKKDDIGWAKRIYDGTADLIENYDMKKFRDDGFKESIARRIVDSKEKILKSLESGRWEGIEGVREKTFQNIINRKAIKIKDADKMVTIDTSRLIRLPDSLHGSSGLIVKRVKDLDSFDPIKDAIAFGGNKITIKIQKDAPEFELSGNKFGPYKSDERIEVPEYAAVYLMLKDTADIAK